MKKNNILRIPALVGLGACLLSPALRAMPQGSNQSNQEKPQREERQRDNESSNGNGGKSQQPQQVQQRDRSPEPKQHYSKVQSFPAQQNNQSKSDRSSRSDNRSGDDQRSKNNPDPNGRNSDSKDWNKKDSSKKDWDKNNNSDRRNANNRDDDRKKYNRGNRYGGRWYPADTHRNWDRNRHYNWNNHQYRWYDGGWLIIDTGYNPFYTSYNERSIEELVQIELADQGYYGGPIDGDVGPGTRRAIARYQSDHGLRVTGQINDALLASLGV